MVLSIGTITTTVLLDRETQSSYQFSVKAEDNGKPFPKRGTALVIIKVLDVNDNAPRFLQARNVLVLFSSCTHLCGLITDECSVCCAQKT